MNMRHLLVALTAMGTLGVAGNQISANAQSLTWHTGTPKAIRGTWYHNGQGDQKAYITYTAHTSRGNLLQAAESGKGFVKLPGYGLKHLKYQRLSKNVYQLSGIQYGPKGQQVQFQGERLTYKLKVAKHQLHFYKGYRTYTKRAHFTIVAAPRA